MRLPAPWRRSGDFRHLGGNERRNFTTLAQAWAASAERNIAARLSEQKENNNVNAA
jgi:hypothetical protein